MSDNNDVYKSMLIGIAIFVGGMIAVVLLTRYLKGAEMPAPAQHLSFNYPVLKPVVEESTSATPPQVLSRSIHVTDQIYIEYDDAQKGLHWSKVDILNNGPNPVYFAVNHMDWPEAPLMVGQSIPVDFRQPGAIKKLFLKCNTGQEANINMFVVK